MPFRCSGLHARYTDPVNKYKKPWLKSSMGAGPVSSRAWRGVERSRGGPSGLVFGARFAGRSARGREGTH